MCQHYFSFPFLEIDFWTMFLVLIFLFYQLKFRPNLYIYLYKSSFRSKTTHTETHKAQKPHHHTNTKRIKKYSDEEEKRGGKKRLRPKKDKNNINNNTLVV